MTEEKRKELIEDLSKSLPYYRRDYELPPLDVPRMVRVTMGMSGITHEKLVRRIYDYVKDTDTRLYLRVLPNEHEDMRPVLDSMFASLDFLIRWRYGCEYRRRLNVLEAVVPEAMTDDDIPGYIDDLEYYCKEAFRLIGATTTCESSYLKK